MHVMASASADSAPLIEVSAGLVFRDGKLLITQRRPGDHLAGLWEFPGGKRDAGETFEDCLVRELQEELGITVAVGALLEDLVHAYAERTVRLRFYACRILDGAPQPLGCHALAWVTPLTLADYAFPAADARLLERLKTDPNLWR